MTRVATLALVALAIGDPTSAATTPPNVLPEPLREVRIDQRLGEQVPLDLVFRDAQGKTLRFGDLLRGDRPVVLTLAYYECPMLCSLVLNSLVKILRVSPLELGDDYDAITVSIDPSETAAMADKQRRTIAHRYGNQKAAENWHFLTGDPASIRGLADAVGFRYQRDEKSGDYAHAAALIVLTPQGKVARYIYGVDYAERDLRLALVEAASNRIGNVVDQVLLFCFRYDATVGRYTASAMNALRAAGVLTVLLMGGYIFTATRRERSV